MTVAISLIVSLCSNVSMDQVKAKQAELERQNPGAKITLRLDKKCGEKAK